MLDNLDEMEIQQHFSLKKLNTFGIEAFASQLVVVKNEDELRVACRLSAQPKRVLGGGSNILLPGDLPGLTLKNEIGGIRIVEETDGAAVVEVGGGVVWHDLVLWAIGQGLGGLENLSLIPGTVGAAPIQNIGAYGWVCWWMFSSASQRWTWPRATPKFFILPIVNLGTGTAFSKGN